MKKLLLIIGLILFFSKAPIAFADTGSDVIQRVDTDISVLNNLLSAVENQATAEGVADAFLSGIPSVVQRLEQSSSFYENVIASETDTELRNIVSNINADVETLTADLSTIQNAIYYGDESSYSTALDNYDNHIDSLNGHIEELNGNLGVADYSWLIWPFLLSIVISISLFIMSRGSPVLPAEQLRNQFEFQLFKTSLWPLFGSGITYIWYIMTPPGGTFYVLYGPILVGFFVFFKGLYYYFTEARPAINVAKHEQKAKLQKLISSEEFQQESIKEEVEDIEELSKEKKCDDCGTINNSEAKFCKKCGIKI